MDLVNEISKKTAEVCKYTTDKTSRIAKEAKLKIRMGNHKSRISELYEKIGKKVYENHVREEKQDLETLTLEECVEIDKHASEIEEERKEILLLRNKKQCPHCYFEIERYYRFCPNCGENQFEKKEEKNELNVEEN